MDNQSVLLQVNSVGIAKDGTTYVVLQWEAASDVVGYNIYRRIEGEEPGESKPINGRTPVTPAKTGIRVRDAVPDDDIRWHVLGRDPGSIRDLHRLPERLRPEQLERKLTDRDLETINLLAPHNLHMAHLAGLAYTDRDVKADEHYLYSLHGVLKNGQEIRLAWDIPVWAGHFLLPDPPSGLFTEAGDRRILVLWNRNPIAATYAVERSTNAGGPYQRVNPQPVAYDIETGIDGEDLPVPRPGYLDISAWDLDGLPTTHVVAGVPISGPDNGQPYWYRVASADNLKRLGAWSAPVTATPVRSIPPMAPDDLQVMPNVAATGMVLKWRKVTHNSENHVLPDTTQTNFVYRAETREELEDLTTLGSYLVATIGANPQDVTSPLVNWSDNDPILVPLYGTKPFFYRVRVVDPAGNISAPSAVIAGTVPDTRPPGRTSIINAEGSDDHVRVTWDPNSEPDLGGYQIYRGVCHFGQIFDPGNVPQKDKEGNLKEQDGRKLGCDMTLVGDVHLGDAKTMLEDSGAIWFDDYSVPQGSPVCYAYWVRAYDLSGNLYAGARGCPEPGDYLCARLLEKTPPPVPVMTGLRARNNGVLVEWMSSPVQDLRAFHVYRADSEGATPDFLGCVFTDGTLDSQPWQGIAPACGDVPAVLNPLAAKGTFLDSTADPHHIYWYHVSALDWLGNESEGSSIQDIPSSSTFSYTSDLPETPTVLSPPAVDIDTCGLEVSWLPVFQPAVHQGFVVFRKVAGGASRQVSGIVTGNDFTDNTARRGVEYLYQVQTLDQRGNLSQPSPPVLHKY